MDVIQYKIWSDLWNNKGGTFQVVLIIAMGAFAVGMIVGSSDLIREDLTRVWVASSPSMINLAVEPAIGDETIQSLRSVRGIEDVEGMLQTSIEWRHDSTEEWRSARLLVRDDYNDQTYAKLNLVSGDWPARKTLAVMQGADTAFKIPHGAHVQIRVDGKESGVDIGGVLYNPLGNPPGFGGNAEFYTTRQRFGELTGDGNFNQLFAGIPEFDEQTAQEVANRIERRLEKLDVESTGLPFPERITSPQKHAFQDILDAIFLILGIMAVLTLLLGLLLVYNTINAIVSQQIDQIGIMKAIGARTGQILRMYLRVVLIYGLLSLLIAIPLGLLSWLIAVPLSIPASYLMTQALAAAIQNRIIYYYTPTGAFYWLVIITVLSIAASWLPARGATRVSVRESLAYQ